MKHSILNFLFTLTHPRYWIMNYGYNQAVEDVLNYIIDTSRVPDRNGTYSVYFKNTEIWSSNYPYAYGTINDLRASRLTLHRFYNYMNSVKAKQIIKQLGELND